jgi:branched-chain amino acid transport system ATP-binding protein
MLAEEAAAAPILEVSGLSIRFGGVHALDDVSITVPDGGFVGLIGPNGAGKTTLFNCLSGLARPGAGSIRFGGEDVTRTSPHRRALKGIGRTFQNVGLCKGETVYSNLKIAQHREAGYATVPGMFGIGTNIKERILGARADELIELLDLGAHRDHLVRDLPVGSAKLVELACVLSSDPSLLLLDEPSSGLGPEESDRLRDVLLRVKAERSLSILMIGHDMRLVMSTAEYIYVLNFGRILAEGAPQEVRDDPEVIAAYLGSEGSKTAGREDS